MNILEMLSIDEKWLLTNDLFPCRACFKLLNNKDINNNGLCVECDNEE